MRLEWLEDILAVIETGSQSQAAKQRLLTQPAFSRRIRVIEAYIGVDLFDRSRKPARLSKAVLEQRENIQELATSLRELLHELKRKDRETQNRIVFASQHAITTAIAPGLIKRLSSSMDIDIRLRSANRDECYALLMTKQADVMVIYRAASEEISKQESFLDQHTLGRERLIPVCASADRSRYIQSQTTQELSIVAYPPGVFFGNVVNRDILPRIQGHGFVRKKAETALTLAVLQCALAGVGLAWVPETLAAPEIANNRLCDLSNIYPTAELSVVAIRLSSPKSPTEEQFWRVITSK